MTDEVRFWRWDDLPGLELSEATLKSRAYPRAYLLNYTFGVRVSGERKTTYRGETFTTGEGFSVYQPGEVLTSRPLAHGAWRYRNLSVTPEALVRLLSEAFGQSQALYFPKMLASPRDDTDLRAAFLDLFNVLTSGAQRLGREEALLDFLTTCAERLADTSLPDAPVGTEHRAVTSVKDYLEGAFRDDVTLAGLAQLTGLSPWYLQRVFKREVGVTPHQYLTAVRLRRAQDLLRQGLSSGQTAKATGFYDRSHFTRVFRRYALASPRVYQRKAGR